MAIQLHNLNRNCSNNCASNSCGVLKKVFVIGKFTNVEVGKNLFSISSNLIGFLYSNLIGFLYSNLVGLKVPNIDFRIVSNKK